MKKRKKENTRQFEGVLNEKRGSIEFEVV